MAIPVKPGTTIGDFDLQDISGTHRISFRSGEKPVVLYIESSQCRWCRRNKQNIRVIAQARSHDFRFIDISLSGIAKPDSDNVGIPVYSLPSGSPLAQRLGLAATPETVVIDTDGKVSKAWYGAYLNHTETEVEAYCGTKLPGLLPDLSRETLK